MRKVDTLVHTNLYYFFEDIIKIMSSLVDEEDRLQPKERRFLTCCCVLNAIGYDLNDYDLLHEGMVKFFPEFSKKSTISQYKLRVSRKKFIRSGNNLFLLPLELDYNRWNKEDMKYQADLFIKKEAIEESINEFTRKSDRHEEGVLR